MKSSDAVMQLCSTNSPTKVVRYMKQQQIAVPHALNGDRALPIYSSCSDAQSRAPTKRCMLCKAAPSFNPQNTPDPKILPEKSMGPEETVRVQLDALKNNDHPWPNHGVQTAYEFGEDIGGMERSRYFGYSKDLYHLDHFLGQFQNAFPELVGLTGYSIESVEEQSNDSYTVNVMVQKGNSTSSLRFVLLRKDVGRKKGALMTKSLLRL